MSRSLWWEDVMVDSVLSTIVDFFDDLQHWLGARPFRVVARPATILIAPSPPSPLLARRAALQGRGPSSIERSRRTPPSPS